MKNYTFIQINRRDVDDFNESKSANPPYIPVLIVADPDSSNFKEQLQYPLTIEGIEVTTTDDGQPKIVIYRTYTHSKFYQIYFNTCYTRVTYHQEDKTQLYLLYPIQVYLQIKEQNQL